MFLHKKENTLSSRTYIRVLHSGVCVNFTGAHKDNCYAVFIFFVEVKIKTPQGICNSLYCQSNTPLLHNVSNVEYNDKIEVFYQHCLFISLQPTVLAIKYGTNIFLQKHIHLCTCIKIHISPTSNNIQTTGKSVIAIQTLLCLKCFSDQTRLFSTIHPFKIAYDLSVFPVNTPFSPLTGFQRWLGLVKSKIFTPEPKSGQYQDVLIL